jgi:hypothetical protein
MLNLPEKGELQMVSNAVSLERCLKILVFIQSIESQAFFLNKNLFFAGFQFQHCCCRSGCEALNPLASAEVYRFAAAVAPTSFPAAC